jgi:hypothetical protein
MNPNVNINTRTGREPPEGLGSDGRRPAGPADTAEGDKCR